MLRDVTRWEREIASHWWQAQCQVLRKICSWLLQMFSHQTHRDAKSCRLWTANEAPRVKGTVWGRRKSSRQKGKCAKRVLKKKTTGELAPWSSTGTDVWTGGVRSPETHPPVGGKESVVKRLHQLPGKDHSNAKAKRWAMGLFLWGKQNIFTPWF